MGESTAGNIPEHDGYLQAEGVAGLTRCRLQIADSVEIADTGLSIGIYQ